MPITPLHVGPGLLCKSALGTHLSLSMFALTQVAMDVEVLLRLAAGSRVLHGFTNTLLGATLVLIVSVPLGKPVCEWCLRQWNARLVDPGHRWLSQPASISWHAAGIGAALGVYSHVILDAIMHADARPWLPFADGNNLLALVSHRQLDLICIGTGVTGIALIAVLALAAARRCE